MHVTMLSRVGLMAILDCRLTVKRDRDAANTRMSQCYQVLASWQSYDCRVRVPRDVYAAVTRLSIAMWMSDDRHGIVIKEIS